METKPALVILSPGFAKDEEDSTCLPMQQSFILTVKKLFPQLNIIILSFHYPYYSHEYSWHGITVIPFNGRNKGGFSKFFLRRKINSKLGSIHKEIGINNILSFWYLECGFMGKRFADKHKITHCSWLWGGDAKKENKFPRRLKPNSNELVALSDFLQDEFEKNHGVRPAHVIPFGIKNDLLPVPPQEKDIDILGAGSLIPLKRYDVFIDVIASLKKQLPGIKVVLIGDGPEKKNLESLIISSGLGSTVTLTSELPYAEVLHYMQRTKVFLHTSSYEGFGAVCIEALSAGAHVISFTKPMYDVIPHWQYAADKTDMIQKTVEIFRNPATEYSPVVPYTVEDSVKKMMKLFGY